MQTVASRDEQVLLGVQRGVGQLRRSEPHARNDRVEIATLGVTPELSGAFVQLARPADGVRYQLPSMAGFLRPLALSSDGRCAAYWTVGADKMSGKLEILDVVHDRRTMIVQAPDVRDIEPLMWLER